MKSIFLRSFNFFTILILLVLPLIEVNAQVKFIIESVPRTTPANDSIFICGTFNNWNVSDPAYLLQKQSDGKYGVVLNNEEDGFEYKFTRGSWMKVETNFENRYFENRIYEKGNSKAVYVNIKNWQDLGGVKRFNYLVLLLFGMALYGVAVFFQIIRTPKKNSTKSKLFITLNAILIVLLLLGVWYLQTNLIHQNYFEILSKTLFFAWGPTLLLVCKVLMFHVLDRKVLWHYFPAFIILIISILRLNDLIESNIFLRKISSYQNLGDLILTLLGIGIMVFYFINSAMVWNRTKMNKRDPYIFSFIQKMIFIQLAAFAFFVFVFLLDLFEIDMFLFKEKTGFLAILSSTIILEFYFFWHYPQLLQKSNKIETSAFDMSIITQIEKKMAIHKPFKQPDLSMAELAIMLDTKPHILSRVINKNYNKNFRDFINEFRVEEFKKLVKSESHKHYTFLAIAFEVGFNSKSTFNLAFKKSTNRSPSDYVKSLSKSCSKSGDK